MAQEGNLAPDDFHDKWSDHGGELIALFVRF
jgi:hypothetical protein